MCFPAALLGLGQPGPAQRQVVALAATAGEDDLVGAAIQDLGDPIAGIVQRAPRAPPDPVHTGRIAPIFQPVGAHRLEHPWIDGRRRGIVQVHGEDVIQL